MIRQYDSPPSNLQIAHATAFSGGLVSLLIGTFTGRSIWFVASGPCLAVSGILILLGCRITFGGPIGTVLRASLGASRVRRLNLRALVWVFAGALISVWGIQRMRAERNSERLLQEPIAAEALSSDAADSGTQLAMWFA
jgi:hypothetical protein